MITAFMRTLILYFLIMLGLRLTGKRQIGELEPSELVMTMMISDLATVPMQDFGIPLLAGVIPILTLLALSLLLSQLSLISLRFRKLTCGTPTVLIRNGELQQSAMRKNRFTLDELLEQRLRREIRGAGKLRPAVGPALAAAPHRRAAGTEAGSGDAAGGSHQRRTGAGSESDCLRKGPEVAPENPEAPGGLSPDGGRAGRHRLREKGEAAMRKEPLIPLAVLGTILAFALWCGAVTESDTDRWRQQVRQAQTLAEAGNWAGTEAALAESYADWSARQTYLHIILEHDAVDDAEAMYRRCMAFAAARESSELRAETADLLDQLRLLSEMEQFDVKNIL